MLKKHPKGLLVAFFTNMGERFGFYTMMAILVLFLQAKYGLSEKTSGVIYSVFYFAIYGLAFLGGVIADLTHRMRRVILWGQIIMFIGYLLMAYPILNNLKLGLIISLVGLALIAIGNGLFKGNLQALVGNLYEAPQYRDLRDRAFNIFYMGINIGAFFAPSAATGIRNWWLKINGYQYDGNLPQLCHAYLNGETVDLNNFQQLADKVSGHHITDLQAFAHDYINVFAKGFHWAFGIAAIAMIVSLLIYLIWQKYLKDADVFTEQIKRKIQEAKKEGKSYVEDKEDVRKRLVALGLVFITVIFFWMAFHQNGLTLTLFARDYTVKTVSRFAYIFFDLRSFLPLIGAIIGLVLLFLKPSELEPDKYKRRRTLNIILGIVLLIGGSFLTYYVATNIFEDQMHIEAEKFQHFNPILIVFLTPVIVWFFGWLNKKGKEPSTPKKIAIGMFIASLAYVILMIGSFGLPAPKEIGEAGSPVRVSQYWLISTYFTLTIAELFLSPMGISFFSKVAPANMKGTAQGLWLGSTALGNLLLQVGTYFWVKLEVWQVWLIFVGVTALAGLFIVSIMKRLEEVAE